MRNQLLFTLLFLCMVITNAKAQDHIVKANLLSPILQTGSFFYEHALADEKSIQLGVFYANYEPGSEAYQGFGITPEYRVYLTEEGRLRGFYMGPYVRYQNLKMTTGAGVHEGKMNVFGGGVVVGRQWIIKDHICMDAFMGPSFNGHSFKIKTDISTPDSFTIPRSFDGFSVRVGFTLGIAF